MIQRIAYLYVRYADLTTDKMKKVFTILLLSAISLSSFSSCKKSEVTPNNSKSTFVKGADIGWVTEMEASGIKFYNSAGVATDCFKLMKDLGMNSIRLRVWVNPKDGYCNMQDVLVKAVRANNLGMRIMIDFHYSDWWADPSKQNKPAAWANYNFDQLKQAVKDHTVEVLNLLKSNNIPVEWVQVGNETNTGMLWPDGQVVNNDFTKYAQLNNAGYDAVKLVYPKALVIVQHGSGYTASACDWLYSGLKAAGGKWDIIGLSVYPFWAGTTWQECNVNALNNMNSLVTKFSSPVMIVETGYSYDKPDEGYLFLKDLIAKTKQVVNGKGLGVMYWEPECNSWNDYKLGSFDQSGKPTKALDAFKE